MATRLAVEEHLDGIAAAGRRLRDAAERAGREAAVPTCPRWTVEDLVTHQGMVHRWAAGHLRGDATIDQQATALRSQGRADPDLLGWFDEGLDLLLTTFAEIPEDTAAAVFLLDAPAPRVFWARRQAHETSIHSLDALSAALGRIPTVDDFDVPVALAVDGIDELLTGFVPRGTGKLNSPQAMRVVVGAVDTGDAWTLDITEAALTTTPGDLGGADVTVTGTAAALYAGLWNRVVDLTVDGPADFVDRWRDEVRIRWR